MMNQSQNVVGEVCNTVKGRRSESVMAAASMDEIMGRDTVA